MRVLPAVLTAACVASIAGLQPPARLAAAPPAQAAAAPSVFLDVSATDDNGRALTSLRREDLLVSIDGEPRKVLSLRYVYRGPGSETAAALANPASHAPAAAERARLMLLAVDETTMAPGDEKQVMTAVTRVLDGLGTSDRAAVVSLPLQSNRVVFGEEPAARRAGLALVVGRRAGTAAVAGADASVASGAAVLPEAPPEDPADPDAAARLAEAEARRVDAEHAARLAALDAAAPPRRVDIVPLVDALRDMPGVKSLIVFRQSAAADQQSVEGQTERQSAEVTRTVLAAARARVNVYVIGVGSQPRRPSAADEELRTIAEATGGTQTFAKNGSDAKALDAIRSSISGGFLVEVESRPGDFAEKPHAITVGAGAALQMSRRGKFTLRSSRFWFPRNDPVPAIVTSSTPAAAVAAVVPAAPAAPTGDPPPKLARRPKPPDAETALLLARMSDFLSRYVQDFANVVAEEEYWQSLVSGGGNGPFSRRLRSDLLLVRTGTELRWMQYRDVFEVDGKPVRDRQERVQKLFLDKPNDSLRIAEEASKESARYNIGTIARTINVPTLALGLLGPTRISTLSFKRDGEEAVNGVKAARLAFEELGRPTLVQGFNVRADAPAVGTLWIDPSNGRILKTQFSANNGYSQCSATVTYGAAGDTGLWVPAEMKETCSRRGEQVEGRAVYKNFRSFKVTTEEQIKK